MVMPLPMTTCSPGFLLRTSMLLLHEANSGHVLQLFDPFRRPGAQPDRPCRTIGIRVVAVIPRRLRTDAFPSVVGFLPSSAWSASWRFPESIREGTRRALSGRGFCQNYADDGKGDRRGKGVAGERRSSQVLV